MTETIIEIDENGTVLPCPTCSNPTPGMAHKCTDYLKALLDKYGGHTAECREYQEGYSPYAPYICIEECGWTAAQKGLGKSVID